MTYRLHSIRDGYSVYISTERPTGPVPQKIYVRDGHPVSSGVTPRVVYSDYMAWRNGATPHRVGLTAAQAADAARHDNIAAHTAHFLIHPTSGYEYLWACAPCDTVLVGSDPHETIDGFRICPPCFEEKQEDGMVSSCDWCGDWSVNQHDFQGNDLCTPCFEGLSYCEECDQSYDPEGGEDHDHHRDCDCISPRENFSIAGATGSTYDSDTNFDVTLSDAVDAYTLTTIRNKVIAWGRGQGIVNAYMLDTPMMGIDPTYKTSEGTYAKRLRSAVYKHTKSSGYFDEPVSLPADLVAEIGLLARENSAPQEYRVQITRDLNREAEYYAHDDSCWWTDYSYSRCTLKSNAGFGLLTMQESRWSEYADGRVWVLPCTIEDGNRLVPTFGEAQAYMVFNGYGELEEGAGARLLAHLTGWAVATNRTVFPTHAARMYINAAPRVVVPAGLADVEFYAPTSMEDHAVLPIPAFA